MRSKQPPRIATWFIRHFGSGANNDVVIGDLNEQYQRGYSRLWYWRQMLIAILNSTTTEIRHHKFLTVSAITFGQITLHVLSNAMFTLYGRLLITTTHARLVRDGLYYDRQPLWVIPVSIGIVLAVGIASGWIVAHLHRRSQPALTIVYALSTVLWWIGFAMVSTVTSSFSLYFANGAIVVTGIIVGGMLAAPPRIPIPQQRTPS
jgi:hypothetical protein